MTHFFDALKLLDDVPAVKQEFRLYFDIETSEPLFYTMDDECGDYIVITKEEFAECRYDVIIVDGKIKRITGISIGKLVPSTIGYGTSENDISIIGNEQYWSLKTYE